MFQKIYNFEKQFKINLMPVKFLASRSDSTTVSLTQLFVHLCTNFFFAVQELIWGGQNPATSGSGNFK